jgi:hypothetical protein
LITKEGNGVKVDIKFNIKWLKDTMMKGTIESSIDPEVRENMEYMVTEMRKVLKVIESLEQGEDVSFSEQHSESADKANTPNELTSLKKRNKWLVIVLIGLVMANVIFMIFF